MEGKRSWHHGGRSNEVREKLSFKELPVHDKISWAVCGLQRKKMPGSKSGKN